MTGIGANCAQRLSRSQRFGTGIARLPDGRRKQALLAAADDVFSTFEDQVLPVDTAAAEHYAAIASRRERAGKPIRGFDARSRLSAALQSAALATRNVSDFDGTGIEIIDPGSSHQADGATGDTSSGVELGPRPWVT